MRKASKLSIIAGCVIAGVPSLAMGADYFIQVGGVCSQDFLVGKGNGRLANLPGVTAVNAQVDQRDNMSTATAQLRNVLDQYCTQDNWCYVYAYSNGGATISRTLSIYATDWNIYWVMVSGSNEGGSELSYSRWAAEIFLGCNLAGHIAPSDHRSGWNHDDTNGNTIYSVSGDDGWWYSTWLLPGEDDGAVAFHSSAGLISTYSVDWLCYDPQYHWANHVTAYTCSGFSDDHYELKMRGICELGGC